MSIFSGLKKSRPIIVSFTEGNYLLGKTFIVFLQYKIWAIKKFFGYLEPVDGDQLKVSYMKAPSESII